MKWRKGPRPWTIRLFAIAFLTVAFVNLIEGLSNWYLPMLRYAQWMPWIEWDADRAIVGVFSEFTIALIPVAWIFGFASRIALWLVTVFTLVKLLDVPNMIMAFQSVGGAASLAYFLDPVLLAIALICLVLPPSRRWFAKPDKTAAAVFE
ncbi:MAG: hypothetical protein AAGK17_00010 [Pseudomonadota bacterium]